MLSTVLVALHILIAHAVHANTSVATDAIAPLGRVRRQSAHNFNFQTNFSNINSFFPPQPDIATAFRHQFPSVNAGAVDPNANPGYNSIRRFPQFPSSQPFSGQPSLDSALLPRQPQVISVLSGSGAVPHQSITWNPPPTIQPPSAPNRQSLQINPQPQSQPLSSSVFLTADQKDERQSRYLPQSAPAPQNSFPPLPSRDPESNRGVTLLSRQSAPVVAAPASPVVPASPAAANTGADKPQKDDVVIYYYYYYDDDKNNTNKAPGDSTPDSIPTLESYDQNRSPGRDKPGRVVIKNAETTDNSNKPVPREQSYGRQDLGSDPRRQQPTHSTASAITPTPLASTPQHLSFAPFQSHREVGPVVTQPSIERPSSTASVSVSVSDQNSAPVSNVFRYGSSVGSRIPFDSFRSGANGAQSISSTSSVSSSSSSSSSTSNNRGDGRQQTSFQPQFPGQAFRHIPQASTQEPPVSAFVPPSTRDIGRVTYAPEDFPPPKQPVDNQLDSLGRPANAYESFSVPTTQPTTITLPTTTTTTSTTTTTTTTPAPPPPEEEAPEGGRRFGNRRRPNANRTNFLNRVRSTTSTTTTTASPTTRGSFVRATRPTVGGFRQRPGRFRKRPGNDEEESPQTTTSTTAAPSQSPVDQTSPSPTRGRFGAGERRRFGATPRTVINRNSPSLSSTTTTSAPLTSRPTVAIRRPAGPIIGSRNRPQLRGRLPFLRNKNQENSEESSPAAPAPTDTPSVVSSEAPVSIASETSPSEPNTPETGNQPSIEETPEVTATSTSTTEKPKGRQLRPLFANRQRSSLFGRRGGSN